MAVNLDEELESGYIGVRVKYDEADSFSAGSLPCSGISEAILRHVQQLGETDIDEYRCYIGADLLHKPWRSQMRCRAEFIARSAKRLDSGKQQEDSSQWEILRSEIMARLSVEVECEKCRARLWNDERITLPERLSSEYAAALKDQQTKRAPCSCDASGSSKEENVHGLCSLFMEETDEEFSDDDDSYSKLSSARKTTHQTYNLRIPNERPLQNKYSCQTLPLSFLVLASEPDEEESDARRGGIRHETAARMAQQLLVQEGLRQDAGETTEWEAGPLAWGVSHRGNHWRVSVLYLEGNDTDECYLHILPLWNGCIHSPSHALQLLLMIDYIVDWGREIYRRAIIHGLIKAFEHEPKPIVHQTRTSMRFNQVNCGSSRATKTKDPLRDYDSQYGVVRDARYVRSLFVALYVTEDNFETLMGSFSPDKRKSLADSILKCLTEAWRVRRGGLDAMEEMWTNKSREGADRYPKDKVFLTVTTITAYLTPSWEPTREFSYLAVAESLLDRLLEIAGLQRHPGSALAGFPMVDDGVAALYSLLKQCTAQDTLKACVARVCRHSGIEPMMGGNPRGKYSDNWQLLLSEMTPEGIRHRLDVVVKSAPSSKARNIVFDLFMEQMVEVSSSLFRVSSLLEELPRPGELKDCPELPKGDECLWGLPPGLPDFEEKNIVLATTADPRKAGGRRDELCVFVMDPTVLEIGLPLATLLETHLDWHLRVKRFHRKHGWGARDGNLSKFICQDQSMAPRLAKYRNHLREIAEQSQSLNDPSPPENAGFWTAKDFKLSENVISEEETGFDFMDALSYAGTVWPLHRLSSMVWRNPPQNAENAVKVSVTVDSNGNLVRARDTGPSTTSRQRGASNNSANGSPQAIVETDASPVGEAEGGSRLLQAGPAGERIIAPHSDSEVLKAGPSKGKRPLRDKLPEQEAIGQSSKRPRVSTAQEHSGDALSNVDFEMYLQAGVFS